MRNLIAMGLLMGLFAMSPPASAVCPCQTKNPLAPYPAYEDMVQEIKALARTFPERVELEEYGRSVQDRPLYYLRLHRPDGQARPDGKTRPAAFIGGNIHGNEWIGNRMVMAVALLLLEQDGQDPLVTRAMDQLDFYLVPSINPDGYFRTAREPCVDDNRPCRKNAHGVDLNRNFPLPGKKTIPIDWGGSPDPESIHYQGPAPLSEPETAALDALFAAHPEITSAISFHSVVGVIYPARCTTRRCVRDYRRAADAFTDAQTEIKYPRLQSRFFDTYTGELEDWLHHHYGVLAIDVEIGRAKMNQKACNCQDLFWTFNPKNPDFWTANDARAAVAYSVEALAVTGGVRLPPEER